MNISFRKELLFLVMLLLCGTFLQSCIQDMPILKPLNDNLSSNSTIAVNANKVVFNLSNQAPGYAYFAVLKTGSGSSATTKYNVNGSNGIKTNLVDFTIDFVLDANNKYVLLDSQFNFNAKNYTTINNQTNNAQLSITKLDTVANTVNGSYGYYLYNSAAVTDSIYVSGTFNIIK